MALDQDECYVGRAHSSQLRLNSDLVSRQHCVIRRIGNRFEIEDLSTNGTFVNGEPVKKRRLKHFDQITVGDSDFLFWLDEDSAPQLAGRVQFSDAQTTTGTAILRRRQDVPYLDPAKVEAALLPAATIAHDLNGLLKISRAINAVRQPRALAQQLLESILEMLPAERGTLLRFVEESEEWTEEALKHRAPASEATIQVNRLLIQQARYNRRPILFNDETPPQSLLIAPLIVDEHVLGVIYLIADEQNRRFDDHHLDLMMTITDMAAYALEKAWRTEWLEQETRRLSAELRGRHRMIGESQRMIEVYENIARAAASDVNVLILGESGTGKELVARAIHDRSRRADHCFLTINCAAIPEALLENELFGHEPGAFTGAAKKVKKGKLEAAHGGTLFLDEIGEMPLALQVKLLRVLPVDPEVKPEFERLGGTRPIQVDIRVLAATNRDLEAAVKSGDFREDLYYRLKVFPIVLPPLRERREDIELLARHFAKKYGEKRQPPVTLLAPEALTCLKNYYWPGNVRELESAIYYAVLHHDAGSAGALEFIVPGDLPEEIRAMAPSTGVPGLDINQVAREASEEAKRRVIREAIKRANGNLTNAAGLLGIRPPNLHRLINELELRAEIEPTLQKPKPKPPSKK